MLEEVHKLREGAPDIYAEKLEELESLVEAGSESAVEAQLHMIREMNPSTREILRQSALRALREDRPEYAIRILEDLVEDRSRFPDLLQLLGLAYSKLGDTKAAEEAFRAALRIHPRYQKARINLALALMEQDQMLEAEKELQIVLENDPSHPLALSAMEEIRVLARGASRV